MDEHQQDSTVVSFIGQAKETIVATAETGPEDGDAVRVGAEGAE